MSGLEVGKCYIIKRSGSGFHPDDVGKPVQLLEMSDTYVDYLFGPVGDREYATSGLLYCGKHMCSIYMIEYSFGDNPVEYHDLNEPKYCVVLAEKGCMMETRNDFIHTPLTKNMVDTYDSEGYTVINYFEIGED